MLFHELNRSGCKTYLLACEQTRKSVLIDPVKERVDRYLGVLAYHRLELEMVIDTHTHADHRTGVWDVRELTGAKVVMHKRAPAPHIDLHVSDGDQLEVGSLPLGFIYTPGHAPDGVSAHTAISLISPEDAECRRLADSPGGRPSSDLLEMSSTYETVRKFGELLGCKPSTWSHASANMTSLDSGIVPTKSQP